MKVMMTVFIAAVLMVSPAASAEPHEPGALRRFAVVIGRDDGGKGRPVLHYAQNDARSVSAVLRELGGLDQSDELLLTNPSKVEVLRSLREIQLRMRHARGKNARTEMILYYSGHSDERGLLLGEERLSYQELRKGIEAASADVRVLILDSCSSGTLTRLKGGKSRPPFLSDSMTRLKGQVVLASTSPDEAAQESDRIQGSYFTHYLVAGLRGAADTSGDQKVTVDEAYHYAYNRTLAKTQATLGGAQHPSYEIKLSGRGQLVMTDLRKSSAKIVFAKGLTGRFSIRDSKEVVVTELEKVADAPIVLGMVPGEYTVTRVIDGRAFQMALALRAAEPLELSEQAFSPASELPAPTMRPEDIPLASGASQLVYLPAEFSLFSGAGTNVFAPERTVNHFVLSLFYVRQAQLQGAGFTLFGVNRTLNDAEGFQFSGLANSVVGVSRGIQIAGVLNYAERAHSLQIAPANVAAEELQGAQVGAFNFAPETAGGLQIGAVNGASSGIAGYQLGAMNLSLGQTQGVQTGAINYSGGATSGLQIGGGSWSQGPFQGLQLSALLNVVQDQEGVVGMQAGAGLNVASAIEGAQIGSVNIAQSVNGAQIGAVNFSSEETPVQIGLLNLAPGNRFRVGYAYELRNAHRISIKFGPRYSYSFIEYGFRKDGGTRWHGKTLGLGGEVPLGRFLVNVEAAFSSFSAGAFFAGTDDNYVQARLASGYRLTEDWSVRLGTGFSFQLNPLAYQSGFEVLPYLSLERVL